MKSGGNYDTANAVLYVKGKEGFLVIGHYSKDHDHTGPIGMVIGYAIHYYDRQFHNASQRSDI